MKFVVGFEGFEPSFKTTDYTDVLKQHVVIMATL